MNVVNDQELWSRVFWHSLVACWLFVALLHLQHLPLFRSMGADSCPVVCCFGACTGHVPTFCLQCTLSFVSVAWCGILVAQHFSWFPSLPLLFWFMGLPLLPGIFFSLFQPRYDMVTQPSLSTQAPNSIGRQT